MPFLLGGSSPARNRRASVKILVLKCSDCGTELNRTEPLTESQASHARINSAFAAGPCPKGCRSTFSDLNINTRIEEVEIAGEAK